ncbi:NB-ARC domain-containing protein [Nonomuraea sp. NPDC059023]|uniref:NB-ARC domain-containing protein n=1 Tax=unclassified Nonomuraea TaxID=2593643 RepID=UPI00369EEC75
MGAMAGQGGVEKTGQEDSVLLAGQDSIKQSLIDPRERHTPAEFVAALRQLKEWMGLTYRQIAVRAQENGDQLARSTIAAVLDRDRLPRQSVVTAMVRACGEDPRPWIEARRRIAAAAGLAHPNLGFALLPPGSNALVGRAEASDRLARLVGSADMGASVTALTGPAGVGKSALAIQVAHRLRGRFPGGCLYVNLQGSVSGVPPLGPGELANRLAAELEGRPQESAEGVEAATRLRALLADRQILVVCDDVASADQLEFLLPLGRRATVLVTTRTARAVPAGGRLLSLRPLALGDAVELLAEELGRERVFGEEEEPARLANLCGRLPLLLRAAGRRLAARPAWRIGALADQLDDGRRGLDELCMSGIDVRARLMASLDLVERSSLRVLAALGRAGSAELPLSALADGMGRDEADTIRALEELSDAHLVDSTEPGRYRIAAAYRWLVEDFPVGRRADPAQMISVPNTE